MKKLVICGDSYGYGIGCTNLETQPFGVLTAKHFGWDLIRLARGSASNYTIYLQGMYAADMKDPPHLVVLNQTSYDRIEWFAEGTNPIADHTALNINYHQYPPHNNIQPHHDKEMDYYFQGNPEYFPVILSEQIGGISDCLDTRTSIPNFTYYNRLKKESNEKLQLIVDYYVRVFDYNIKKNYDIGMLLQAYTYLKRKDINCIIMTRDVEAFSKFIDKKDIMHQDWWELSTRLPDTIGSRHTSEEGHKETADRLIQHIKDANLD